MSEPKSRSLQEIQAEYQQVCARAGHLQYQIDIGKEELSGLNLRLKDLNNEAAALAKAEEAAKKEESKNV